MDVDNEVDWGLWWRVTHILKPWYKQVCRGCSVIHTRAGSWCDFAEGIL